MSISTEVIAAIAGGSGIGGIAFTKFFDWASTRKANKKLAQNIESQSGKFDAEALQAITSAAVSLVAPLQAEITELRGRVELLEEENASTKTLLESSIDYIRALRSWIATHIPDLSPPQPPADLGL